MDIKEQIEIQRRWVEIGKATMENLKKDEEILKKLLQERLK